MVAARDGATQRVYLNALRRWASVYAGLRLLTGAWIAWVSTLRPFSILELLVPLWPPRAPWGEWAARVLLLPWLRWDAHYYVRMVTQGYALRDGTAQFHPLYPLLAWPLTRVGLDPLLALLLVSSLAAVAFLAALEVWLSARLGGTSARRVVLAFLLSPFAAFLLFPYTEPLFLLGAVLTLLALHHRRWGWAAAGAALATLTRQQGVFLMLPIAWELWQQRRTVPRAAWASLAGAPLAWAGWVLYRALALGDWQPQVDSLQSLVYSVLISRSHKMVVPEQAFLWPWEALGRAWRQTVAAPDVDMLVNGVLMGVLVALLIVAWRRLTGAERVYSLAIVLVSFAYYTGPVHPYMGLPRHGLLAFPFVVGIAPLTRRSWQRVLWSVAGVLGLLMVVMVYGLQAWVP